MSRLLSEWRDRKVREDELLHDQLRGGLAAGRVQVFTDPRILDFPGSPVHQHWDHLLPLTLLMTLALIILLAAGIAIGIVVMTLCVLAHLFGNKYYVAWRLKIRALAYLTDNVAQFQALWQLGGVALVMRNGNEPPCLAPRGDWRKFIRRNLGEGETQRPEPLANAPAVSRAAPPRPEPEPEPEPVPQAEPMADSLQPDPVESAAPRTHWESIDDPAPRDEVVPPPPRP
ncbi:hypothetical protein [Magnetospirillum sp. SS-4]|uniref:hypothetical protein n=1 Tax=Magnetospirillum sp. SS-4 TaxID=2681465 RepID=UPI001383E65E|nr:hypothetical protein [Magnetospirillum sp. SS-4]CAA7620873.1 conserved hypothetical protein [Magnetospirillum sp. SS-4]